MTRSLRVAPFEIAKLDFEKRIFLTAPLAQSLDVVAHHAELLLRSGRELIKHRRVQSDAGSQDEVATLLGVCR